MDFASMVVGAFIFFLTGKLIEVYHYRKSVAEDGPVVRIILGKTCNDFINNPPPIERLDDCEMLKDFLYDSFDGIILSYLEKEKLLYKRGSRYTYTISQTLTIQEKEQK